MKKGGKREREIKKAKLIIRVGKREREDEIIESESNAMGWPSRARRAAPRLIQEVTIWSGGSVDG